jgi:hypothetical protein
MFPILLSLIAIFYWEQRRHHGTVELLLARLLAAISDEPESEESEQEESEK